MDFYEAVDRRRSVREFQPKPVEEKKILRILEAGIKAPSHNHLREWEFILIRDPAQRREIVEIGAKLKNVTNPKELDEAVKGYKDKFQQEMYLKALPVQRSMLISAPELLIPCFRMRKPLKDCRTLFDLNCFASIWACIENILLAMAAEGLYGVTCIPFETATLKRILNVPKDYEIAAMIPIGYPKEYHIKQKGVSLREKVHINEWQAK